jgi:hypothetical protein
MDLQAFQRMMQIFPAQGITDPSQGTGMGPGMNVMNAPAPDVTSDISSGLDSYQPRTAISDKLTARLGEMPVRPEPGMLRRIGASIAGFGAGGGAQAVVGGQPIGYKYDPKAADFASNKVEYGDFDNQLNDWQNQIKALGIGANEEDRANAGEVKRLAGNAKNEIDQQKIDVANKRADAYQQNADTKIQEEKDKHEYSMQKLRDNIATAEKKLALAKQNYELKKNSTEAMQAYHDAELASIAARREAQTEDDKFKLEDQKRRTDSTIEYNRIRGEALQSGKVTDTSVTMDKNGNPIAKRVVTRPGGTSQTLTDPDGNSHDVTGWTPNDINQAKLRGWK